MTAFIVTSAVSGRRSTEEIRELHDGFRTVLVLSEQIKNLNKTVERIASSMDRLQTGQDAMDRRLVALEQHVKGDGHDQQQGQRRTG